MPPKLHQAFDINHASCNRSADKSSGVDTGEEVGAEVFEVFDLRHFGAIGEADFSLGMRQS
eukprot:1076137-Amphidinium_carterae.1